MHALVWLRSDLRLTDHPALMAAIKTKLPLIVYFHFHEEDRHPWELSPTSLAWLADSLNILTHELKEIGGHLTIGHGPTLESLLALVKKEKVSHLFFHEEIEPALRKRDAKIKKAIENEGVVIETFFGNMLFSPEDTLTPQGAPYKVYTPFWNALQKLGEPDRPLSKPSHCQFAKTSSKIDLNHILQKLPEHKILENFWEVGCTAAHRKLQSFIKNRLTDYTLQRDFPGQSGTSLLSPHLRFGEISPKEIWHAVRRSSITPSKSLQYLKEIAWREFAYYTLYHFPNAPLHPLRPAFNQFPWIQDNKLLHLWQQGKTGYPIIDAGMRQLIKTGWMHNRIRMIVASFLVKDLLLPWQDGAKWFWQHLVDADLANNTLGWQWSAGCGTDAAPYFRIFNPVTQSKKFDPEGTYIKTYVPELQNLDKSCIHNPGEAPPLLLKERGVILGKTYPYPICDHEQKRKRALAAFAKIK